MPVTSFLRVNSDICDKELSSLYGGRDVPISGLSSAMEGVIEGCLQHF